MSVRNDREGWTTTQVALVAVILALALGGVAAAALGLGWIRLGASAAGSPSPQATSYATHAAPVATPTAETAAQAICGAFDRLWTIQTDHAIPLASRVSTWISAGTGPLDGQAALADARAIGEGSVAAGTKIASITFSADPALLGSLKQSVAGYGQGSVSLKKWLDTGDLESRASADMLDGLQQVEAGAKALQDANLIVGTLHASGTLTCDARY
jgi:hypothetical protein